MVGLNSERDITHHSVPTIPTIPQKKEKKKKLTYLLTYFLYNYFTLQSRRSLAVAYSAVPRLLVSFFALAPPTLLCFFHVYWHHALSALSFGRSFRLVPTAFSANLLLALSACSLSLLLMITPLSSTYSLSQSVTHHLDPYFLSYFF